MHPTATRNLSTPIARNLFLAATIFSASACTGCFGPTVTGTFDKTLTVSGAIQLELRGGSGRVEIRSGPADQVRVHGEYRIWEYGFDRSRDESEEISEHPPVELQGNLVKIGTDVARFSDASIDYTIYVPTQTSTHVAVGSGRVEIGGIDGPVDVSSGSGHLSIRDIHHDVRIGTSSGGAEVQDVQGQVRALSRSGSLSLTQVGGDITAEASSGHIIISHPGGRVEAHGGSGGVEINGMNAELRATSGSGHVTIGGDPSANSYWDISASSGNVSLNVSPSANFRLYAHSSSGGVHAGSIVNAEETGRHSLRGRAGNGGGRVEIETRSGSISVH